MDKHTASLITQRMTAKHRVVIPARERQPLPSAYRPVSARLAHATHGVIRRVEPDEKQAMGIHSHGLVLATVGLVIPIGLANWALRHARQDRPIQSTIYLIRERDLIRERLMPTSLTVTEQLPHSRYLEMNGRWNRSRSNRWGSEDQHLVATEAHHIGFTAIGAAGLDVLKTLGASVNVQRRRMTLASPSNW